MTGAVGGTKECRKAGGRAGAVAAGLAIVACGILFLLLLGTTGPTSSDSVARLALGKYETADLLATPLPDGTNAPFFRPLPSLAASLLTASLPGGGIAPRIVAFCLHALCVLLVLRVLNRLLGRPAGATAAAIYALHPIHAGLFASPLTGVHASIGNALLLALLLALSIFRRRPTVRAAGLCLVAIVAAALSSDSLAIPLIFVAACLLFPANAAPGTPSERKVRSGKGRSFLLCVTAFAAYGAVAAWQYTLLGTFPGAGLRLDGAVARLAAFPLPGAAGGAGTWIAIAPVALVILLAARRVRRDGFRFVRPALSTLILFGLALLTTGPSEAAGSSGLLAATPALVFFCAAAGLLLAGPAARATGRTGSPAALFATPIFAALLFGGAAVAPCLEMRQAAGDAAAAGKALLVKIAETQRAADIDTVFLFNRPRTVAVGTFPAAEYLRHDLALETVAAAPAARSGKAPTVLPTHGSPAIGDRPPVVAFSKRGVLCCAADAEGRIEGFLFTKVEVDSGIATMRALSLDKPVEKSQVALVRNGFPLSFPAPPEATGYRVVLLTPLGPLVVDRFETRLSYVTGRETLFVDDARLRDALPLFSGTRIALWPEAVDRNGKTIRQGPFVALHLLEEDDRKTTPPPPR